MSISSIIAPRSLRKGVPIRVSFGHGWTGFGTAVHVYNNICHPGHGIHVGAVGVDYALPVSCGNDLQILTNDLADVWSDYNIFPIDGSFGWEVDAVIAGGGRYVRSFSDSGLLSGLDNWQTRGHNGCGDPASPINWYPTHADPNSTTNAVLFSTGTYRPSTNDRH